MVKNKIIELQTKEGQVTFLEIREAVLSFLESAGIRDGIVNIHTPHTTCSVYFEEMVHDTDFNGTDLLEVDLLNRLRQLFPKEESGNGHYRYPGPKHIQFAYEADPPVVENPALLFNADAHLIATMIGSNITIPVIDGVLQTGAFGYIFFADWDTCRARTRKVILTAMGE